MSLQFTRVVGEEIYFRDTKLEHSELKPLSAPVILRLLDMYAGSLRPDHSLRLAERQDKQMSGIEMYRGLKAAGQVPADRPSVEFFKKLSGEGPLPKRVRKQERRAKIKQVVATPV